MVCCDRKIGKEEGTKIRWSLFLLFGAGIRPVTLSVFLGIVS